MGKSLRKPALVFCVLIFMTAAVCAFAYGAQPPLSRFEYSEVAMGVRAKIIVYAANENVAKNACGLAYARMAELEDIMSDYRPESELMRLSASAGGPPVKVSTDLMKILHYSQQLAEFSDGAFDVTVGPVVKLWRRARKSGELPADDEIKAALRLVGWKKLELDEKKSTARLDIAGMQLDLGGIAKGYACSEALSVLKQNGINSALVEMGGDIAIGCPPPGEKGWKIEIANAPDDGNKYLILSNAAVSSSGDTEQYVEIDGKRYSHIVDPRTGVGLASRIAVTVVADNCTKSDALATAICVLGRNKGLALTGGYPLASVYIKEAKN